LEPSQAASALIQQRIAAIEDVLSGRRTIVDTTRLWRVSSSSGGEVIAALGWREAIMSAKS
ncbi:hypothetical protein RQ832_32115, partial [Roseomonas sp. DSM 102946]|nr:hypothetical protein [Roseomonas sp. DSM 102946]